MKNFTVKENCNLKDFAGSVYPQGSFCLSALLRGKDIKVNGVRVNANVKLKAGDKVVFYTTPAQESKTSHSVVFEDGNVLIADKFSGVTSEGLLCELCEKGNYYACHRLDRNTQGLLVFAKNAEAERELLAAFKNRKVEKVYYAVCKDGFKDNSAVLTAYLKKDPSASEVKIFGGEVKGSVKIVTEYRVEARRGGLALVKVTLHTGKTHQIRAHLAFIGCPVLGDGKYGDGVLNKERKLSRQQLVAKFLTFKTGGVLSYLDGRTFESALNPTW